MTRKLKITYLMIGDWVCWEGDVNLEDPVMIDGVGTYMAGVDGDWMDEWLPIPLTMDVLTNKNGYFKECLEDTQWLTNDYYNISITDDHNQIISDNKWLVVVKRHNELLFRGEITYVHELQHIYNLLNFEEGIKL